MAIVSIRDNFIQLANAHKRRQNTSESNAQTNATIIVKQVRKLANRLFNREYKKPKFGFLKSKKKTSLKPVSEARIKNKNMERKTQEGIEATIKAPQKIPANNGITRDAKHAESRRTEPENKLKANKANTTPLASTSNREALGKTPQEREQYYQQQFEDRIHILDQDIATIEEKIKTADTRTQSQLKDSQEKLKDIREYYYQEALSEITSKDRSYTSNTI